MKLCKVCQEEIHPQRLKILPNTETCVKCSTTPKVAGFRIISGKTSYSEMQIVSQEKYKELTKKQARRGQSPGLGIWMNSTFAGQKKDKSSGTDFK